MSKIICNSIGQTEECPKCSCSIPHTKSKCQLNKKCNVLEKECEDIIEKNYMEDSLEPFCFTCGAMTIQECICDI